MFKGIHNILNKPGQKSANIPSFPGLFPILSANELLAPEERQEILKKLPALSTLSTNEYNLLYLKAIHNFAEFAQSLPGTKISYYSHQGGLLDHGLDRALLALMHCHSYFLETEKHAEQQEITVHQSLWIYAIFTAALLLDVGKAAVKQYISLCDAKGTFIKQWSPYKGTMLSQPPATHFKVDFEPDNRERLKNLVTPLLARQILPVAGFDWIASDSQILEAWLAILSDDQTGGGLLPMILPLADAQTIEAQIIKMEIAANIAAPLTKPSEGEAAASLPKLFTPGPNVSVTGQPYIPGAAIQTVATAATSNVVGSVSSTSTIMLNSGIAFLLWLRKGVLSGRVAVNTAAAFLHRTNEGIVILPKAFAEFAKANPQYKDINSVAQQFSLLELTGREQKFRQTVSSTETRIINNAMIVTNVLSIFPADKLPPVSENIVAIPPVVTEVPKTFTTTVENIKTPQVVDPAAGINLKT